MKVKVIKRYHDKLLDRSVKVGEILEITDERYEAIKKYEAENNTELIEAVVEKEEKKEKQKKK